MILLGLCCSTSIMCTLPYCDARVLHSVAAAGCACSLFFGVPATPLATMLAPLTARLATQPPSASALPASSTETKIRLIQFEPPLRAASALRLAAYDDAS